MIEKLRETARERPKRFALSIFLILFWIAAPLASQIYFDFSAVTVSFSVTVAYFLIWKAYKRFY